jgi:hypothetical protein
VTTRCLKKVLKHTVGHCDPVDLEQPPVSESTTQAYNEGFIVQHSTIITEY